MLPVGHPHQAELTGFAGAQPHWCRVQVIWKNNSRLKCGYWWGGIFLPGINSTHTLYDLVLDDQEQTDTLVSQMIAFETGEMQPEESLSFIRNLIDTGLAWQLKGVYRSVARAIALF